jgi:hypothetical protein
MGAIGMRHGQSGCARSRCSIAQRSRCIEANSSLSVSVAFGSFIICAICLCVLSMKPKPSVKVIVSMFSQKRSTVADAIRTSLIVYPNARIVRPRIIAARTASAKQNGFHFGASWQCERDGMASRLLQNRHVQRWCDGANLATKSRNVLFSVSDPLHGKGDLSIRLTSSTARGTRGDATTTFCAVTGRS